MQNRREVNQDGLRPFTLCAVNCKKGSKPTCGVAADPLPSRASPESADGPLLPFGLWLTAAAQLDQTSH